MGIVERLNILKKRLDEPKNDLERANNRIKELEQEVKEYKTILEIGREREYHSKFLKDFQKEKGKNVFPDHDEIYKRYDDYKSRCERAIEYIEKHTITYNKNLINETQEFEYISTSPKELLFILRGSDK